MVIHPPSICLIETEAKSNKSYEVVGYKEVVKQERRDNGRDEYKGHPNNEDLSGREHDLGQTGFECNTRDLPVIVVRSLNAMKGSWKGYTGPK